MRQQVRQAVGVRRWLSMLREDIPADHRGAVTVLEGRAVSGLVAHIKDRSALLIGRAPRRWWAPLKTSVAEQIARRSQAPVLVVSGRRPREVPVAHMSTPLADGLHILWWMSRYLPHCRVVGPPDRTTGTARRRSASRSGPEVPRPVPHPPGSRSAGADLIVVSASRPRSMREILQAHLSKSVLNGSTCSVLVVPASG